MYLEDLVLNNLQWLICRQTKPNQTKSNKFTLFLTSNLISDLNVPFFIL